MTTTEPPLFDFDDSFARGLEGLFQDWSPDTVSAPEMVAFNRGLAIELGLDPSAVDSADLVSLMVGNELPAGARPIAMAYAGHQFGGYSPVLGDGRAVLIGEVIAPSGARRDLHLKGSGRTPFSRGGDGKAALGPMLREFLIAEALQALAVPTTRALAVVATGEQIRREGPVPGAVLARVAASHLRVGTFEFAARLQDRTVLRRLADHAIARHYPAIEAAEGRYLALLDAVVEAQAELVAKWMLLGFIHGVMNTDNMTISGEGIDYGPCAFMDAYDPATVFSSIDHAGRYAYQNQPMAAHWNLARLAESLLSLIDTDSDRAIAAAMATLNTFDGRYRQHFEEGMATKLGLPGSTGEDLKLIEEWLELLAAQRVDYTTSFRALARRARGDTDALSSLFADRVDLDQWVERWLGRLGDAGLDASVVGDEMDQVNPLYIARNHLVEEALAAAESQDFEPFRALLDAVSHPHTERPGLERFALPAPDDFGRGFKTFCGT